MYLKDCAGVKFGKLTAVKIAGQVLVGVNKTKAKVWLCKCECGRTDEVNQNYLFSGRVSACKVCRRGPCVTCGGPITDESSSVLRNVCSTMCHKERKRANALKSRGNLLYRNPDFHRKEYKKRLAADPLLNERINKKRKQRISKLTEAEQMLIASKKREREYAYLQKIKETDPEKYEKYKQKKRMNARKHKQARETAELQRIGQQLIDKKEEDTAE